ncbi:MAG: hypothetical protein GEV05_24375 [Betaproteobacteria bacterium]|nr:hypothetical protein [Betaproteobacteria bacterium]
MKLSFRTTIQGIELAVGDDPFPRLTPAPDTPQDKPRGCYVYAHVTEDGKYFYIGKGKDRRAWSEDRHPTWYRYVENHLNGKYRVVILQDNLSPAEVEDVEAEWIAQEGETLVNWVNAARKTDFKKLELFHKLRDANRALIAKAKALEKTDIEKSIACYREVIAAIEAYATLDYEDGIIGQLLREEREEHGLQGTAEAIDRLTMCLTKLGRYDDAAACAEEYYRRYAVDKTLASYERVMKRLERRKRAK